MKNNLTQLLILSLLAIIILSISCQTLDPVALTKFSSKPPEMSEISYNSATVSSNFMDVGDGINSYGHCWAISSLPTVDNSKKENAGKPERQYQFTSKLDNLAPETQYYVRAYAADGNQIVYSKQIDFKTLKKKSIHITKPKTGDKWNINSTQLIEWTDDIDENVKITLLKNNAKKSELVPSTESDGIYEWTVPATAELSNDYAIKIESISDANISDTSDLFSIKDDPYISISSPNSTDTWTRNNQYELKWTDNVAENVNIELYKAGAKNSDIALNVLSNGSYMWTIPHALTAGSDYNIKITSTANSSITVQSDPFKIAEEPYISITAPAANAKWIKGQQFQISWTDNISENVNIELYKAGTKNSDIELNTASDGSYTWTVPAALIAASDYTIKITSTTNSAVTNQSSQFTIADAPSITITAPAIGTEWTDGKEYEIKWTDNITENVDIELFKNGVKNSNISLNTPSDQSHLWTIPTSIVGASNYTIKITSVSNSSVVGESAVFTIVDAPFITIGTPALNDTWFKGQEYEIKWTDNISENVSIELYKGGVKERDIIVNTPSDQIHLWTVASSLANGNDYTIKITSTLNGSIVGESNKFSIMESTIAFVYTDFENVTSTIFNLNSDDINVKNATIVDGGVLNSPQGQKYIEVNTNLTVLNNRLIGFFQINLPVNLIQSLQKPYLCFWLNTFNVDFPFTLFFYDPSNNGWISNFTKKTIGWEFVKIDLNNLNWGKISNPDKDWNGINNFNFHLEKTNLTIGNYKVDLDYILIANGPYQP